MQTVFSTTTALAAKSQVASIWKEITRDGEPHYATTSCQADQSGLVSIQECDAINDQNPKYHTAVSAQVQANVPLSVQTLLTRRYFRVVYTNGATAQTSFSLSLVAGTTIPPTDQTRLLELILRELRTTNLLLQQLSEPEASSEHEMGSEI